MRQSIVSYCGLVVGTVENKNRFLIWLYFKMNDDFHIIFSVKANTMSSFVNTCAKKWKNKY